MRGHAMVNSLASRLRWVENLRWVAALCVSGLALFVHFALGLALAWRALLALSGVLALYNAGLVIWRRRLERGRPEWLTDHRAGRFVCGQIAGDLLILTLCLHYSGGVENPLVIVYVLPPVIASVLLSPGWAYLLAAWAMALYAFMAVGHAVWPSLHHGIVGHPPVPLFGEPVFVSAEGFALAVTVYVSVYLAGSVATRLRKHEHELAEATEALEARSAELVAMNRELRELEERKSRFLGLAAHQLRGPLAVTEGCLACACDGYETDPQKQAEFISRARIRVQGMLEVVRDLLTLAQTHDLTASARRSAIALDDVAGRVVEQYMDFAASRHVDLVFYPGAPRAEVMGDARALVDALGNLVSNAIKYTHEGGHVKVATRIAGSEVVCEVIDDGIGIPETEMDNVFKEFYRAANARTSGREGSGLGLSIVTEVVQRLGGRLKVESLEKLGTCVIVTLPTSGPSAPWAGDGSAETTRVEEASSA